MQDNLIRTYTDFIFVKHEPQSADVIFVPGSETKALGEKAAELWKAGMAPYILVSGRYSILKNSFAAEEAASGKTPQFETEAAYLADVMYRNGVPEDAVWKEETATYTYENAILSKKMLDARGYTVKTAILCCKPFHARRSLLYYQLLFPKTKFYVCPCDYSITEENWYRTKAGIDTVLGEIARCGTQFGEILKSRIKNETES